MRRALIVLLIAFMAFAPTAAAEDETNGAPLQSWQNPAGVWVSDGAGWLFFDNRLALYVSGRDSFLGAWSVRQTGVVVENSRQVRKLMPDGGVLAEGETVFLPAVGLSAAEYCGTWSIQNLFYGDGARYDLGDDEAMYTLTVLENGESSITDGTTRFQTSWTFDRTLNTFQNGQKMDSALVLDGALYVCDGQDVVVWVRQAPPSPAGRWLQFEATGDALNPVRYMGNSMVLGEDGSAEMYPSGGAGAWEMDGAATVAIKAQGNTIRWTLDGESLRSADAVFVRAQVPPEGAGGSGGYEGLWLSAFATVDGETCAVGQYLEEPVEIRLYSDGQAQVGPDKAIWNADGKNAYFRTDTVRYKLYFTGEYLTISYGDSSLYFRRRDMSSQDVPESLPGLWSAVPGVESIWESMLMDESGLALVDTADTRYTGYWEYHMDLATLVFIEEKPNMGVYAGDVLAVANAGEWMLFSREGADAPDPAEAEPAGEWTIRSIFVSNTQANWLFSDPTQGVLILKMKLKPDGTAEAPYIEKEGAAEGTWEALPYGCVKIRMGSEALLGIVRDADLTLVGDGYVVLFKGAAQNSPRPDGFARAPRGGSQNTAA